MRRMKIWEFVRFRAFEEIFQIKIKKLRGSLSREENYSSLFLLFLEENSSTGTFFNKSLRWMQRLQSVTTAFYVKKKIHLRHKWLRGQRVQLIKVEEETSRAKWEMFILRPVEPQNSSDMLDSICCLFGF